MDAMSDFTDLRRKGRQVTERFRDNRLNQADVEVGLDFERVGCKQGGEACGTRRRPTLAGCYSRRRRCGSRIADGFRVQAADGRRRPCSGGR